MRVHTGANIDFTIHIFAILTVLMSEILCLPFTLWNGNEVNNRLEKTFIFQAI